MFCIPKNTINFIVECQLEFGKGIFLIGDNYEYQHPVRLECIDKNQWFVQKPFQPQDQESDLFYYYFIANFQEDFDGKEIDPNVYPYLDDHQRRISLPTKESRMELIITVKDYAKDDHVKRTVEAIEIKKFISIQCEIPQEQAQTNYSEGIYVIANLKNMEQLAQAQRLQFINYNGFSGWRGILLLSRDFVQAEGNNIFLQYLKTNYQERDIQNITVVGELLLDLSFLGQFGEQDKFIVIPSRKINDEMQQTAKAQEYFDLIIQDENQFYADFAQLCCQGWQMAMCKTDGMWQSQVQILIEDLQNANFCADFNINYFAGANQVTGKIRQLKVNLAAQQPAVHMISIDEPETLVRRQDRHPKLQQLQND